MNIALEIGEVKKQLGLPVIDQQRETIVLDQIKNLALEKNLDPTGLKKVFKEIIRLSSEAQEKKR